MRTFEKCSIVASAFLVAACAHTEPAIQVREVEVPVPQPCLTAEQLEDERYQEPALVGDRLTGDPAQDVVTLAASALRLRAWGQELIAAHRACADVQ